MLNRHVHMKVAERGMNNLDEKFVNIWVNNWYATG